MTRGYARSKKGQRAIGKVPRNRGSNLSLISALSLEAFGAEIVIEGAVDGDSFEAWVEQAFLPWLKPNQVVIWDNVPPHHRPRIRTLIESVGCRLIFTPAYSPDFSPIEEAFSKIKSYLKMKAARTKDSLLLAIAEAIKTISPMDIHGWFRHCGYLFPVSL
jgi:transposase